MPRHAVAQPVAFVGARGCGEIKRLTGSDKGGEWHERAGVMVVE